MKKGLQLNDVPAAVLHIQICKMHRIPVGITLYNETIEKYPEYFPKEFAHKKKWESIPQSVHDAYWHEFDEFRKKLWENEPKPPGIMATINQTPEAKQWQDAFDRIYPLEEKKRAELHKKYYKPYGV